MHFVVKLGCILYVSLNTSLCLTSDHVLPLYWTCYVASTTIVLYESNPRVLSVIVVFDVLILMWTHSGACTSLSVRMPAITIMYHTLYMNTVSTLYLLIWLKSWFVIEYTRASNMALVFFKWCDIYLY